MTQETNWTRDELIASISEEFAMARHPLFRYGRAKEGLGRSSMFVFCAIPPVGHPGITFAELIRATLHSPATLRKYLNGLRDVGLITETDEKWCATGISLDDAEQRSKR